MASKTTLLKATTQAKSLNSLNQELVPKKSASDKKKMMTMKKDDDDNDDDDVHDDDDNPHTVTVNQRRDVESHE